MTLELLETRSRVATRRTPPAKAPVSTAAPLAAPAPSVGWFAPAALVLSVLALGCALQVNFGQYHPLALAWLSVALLACAAAVVAPNFGRRRVAGLRPDLLLAGLALGVQFVMLLTTNPAATIDPSRLLPFRVGLLLAAGSAVLAVRASGKWRTAGLALMLLTHFVLGGWVLRAAPHPRVDVYAFQAQACDALLRGENPYAITFADPNPATSDRFYAPGVSVNGRLHFGYPYPPLTLLMALPGHVLAGDYRWSQLAAMTLAGGLIAFMGSGAMSVLAAALLLFTPRGFFVLEAGWTEPFVVLLLALVAFFVSRPRLGRSLALPVTLGLFLVSKQYLVLALPLLPLLWSSLAPARRTTAWRALVVAAAAAAFVSLPLALWDVPAFLHSAVTLQFHQPVRTDALSYLVPASALLERAPPAWFSFAAVVPVIVLCLRRRPRVPAGFALAVALTFLVFFAFNKQAFCNYYHLVLGGLCVAVGSLPRDPKPAHQPQPY
jgi:hypothetical protein